MENYSEEYTHFYTITIVVVVLALLLARELFNVQILPNQWMFYVCILGAGALLKVAIERETYLPFLGKTVLPSALLTEKANPLENTTSINVKVPPNTKVVYWAALPTSSDTKTPLPVEQAYNNYENSGVTTSDDKGNAVLNIQPPQSYRVPSLTQKVIKSHVHYRYALANGMMSDVLTLYV
jgi:hypothetical protein